MLTPELEIHPAYLRTLRQTLNDVLLPEIGSASGRNALLLCDLVLVRLIGALEENPITEAAFREKFDTRLQEITAFTGEQTTPPTPTGSNAAQLQTQAHILFKQLDVAKIDERGHLLELLAKIAAANASYCEGYETAIARIGSQREPPLRSLLVTPEAVQTYLSRHFPDRDLRLRNFEQLPGGRSKLTILLSVEGNPLLPSEMVMRMDNPGSSQGTTVSDEFPVLQAAYRAGVRAPEPLWLETDAACLGAPFLVMRKMPGSAVDASVWSAEGVRPQIALALAETLASLHRNDARTIWPMSPNAACDAVALMIARLESVWRACESVSSVTIECAYAWLKRHISCISGHSSPVHGDVHFGNILADGDALTCLTDWEFAHPGHPAEDLAFCRGYVEQIMSWNDFIEHYRACGGARVDEEQLRFFAIWRYLRNVTLATNMLKRIVEGSAHDIGNLAIALNSRARIEASLAQALSAEMKRDVDR